MHKLSVIVRAIEEAHFSYEELSGTWLWEGAEYYLTVSIAQHIKSNQHATWVTIEEPLKSDYFLYPKGRPSNALRRGGRVDIALWDEHEAVSAIIEVKSAASPSTCKSDFERLCLIVSKLNNVEAYFAYNCSNEKKDYETLISWHHKWVKKMENVAESVAKKYDLKIDMEYKITQPTNDYALPSSSLCLAILLSKT